MKETSNASNPASISPSVSQIKNIPLPDEHLDVAYAKNPIGFCQECGHHCLRKTFVLISCKNYRCYCGTEDVRGPPDEQNSWKNFFKYFNDRNH